MALIFSLSLAVKITQIQKRSAEEVFLKFLSVDILLFDPLSLFHDFIFLIRCLSEETLVDMWTILIDANMKLLTGLYSLWASAGMDLPQGLGLVFDYFCSI